MSFRLLFTHVRIKFKQKFYEFFSIKKTHENFLGFTVFFTDYGWFANMWRAIFLSETYYFKTDNAAPLILDIGSNIGMSVCYFKMLYPKSKILAFEPEPASFTLLKKNIEANHFENVTLNQAAISADKDAVDFYQDTVGEASAVGSTLKNFLPPERTKAIKVKAVRLSQLIKEKVDLLKICAEGVEHEILKEAESGLGNVQRIFILVHQRDGNKNENISGLLGVLERSGFRYAVTETTVSHDGFIDRPFRAYAFIVDSERIN